MKRELERVDIPGEHEARQRAWAVVDAAFTAREPTPRPSHWPRVAAVAVAASAILAATLSAPGRAVLDEIREVVGVERAQPALFSLPAPGRLLVSSDAGVWIVQHDGSKRLLGDYREASWSPFGRFVIAAGGNELVALEPDGDVRWTLPRPRARSPRWGGSLTDTRIAYLSDVGELRIVAGDGTGDRRLGRARPVPPAWRPTSPHVLAYVAPRGERIILADAESGRRLRSWPADPPESVDERGRRVVGWPFGPPGSLEWSRDGRHLLVFTPTSIRVYDANGRFVGASRGEFRYAVLGPGSNAEVAGIREYGGVSELVVGNRVLFRGTGEFRDLAWSPDGRWLLVGWPAAGQWVFVRADGRGIRAVSNIAKQFRSASFPRVEGWCCVR